MAEDQVGSEIMDMRDRLTRLEVIAERIEKLESKVDILSVLVTTLSTRVAVLGTRIAIVTAAAAGGVTYGVNLLSG